MRRSTKLPGLGYPTISTLQLSCNLNLTKLYGLVPKKIQPIISQDFRPISLCNVIYKIIAKSLTDRLKPHLPNFIDQAQAAFIKNMHISSNIIIT